MATVIDATDKELTVALVGARYDVFLRASAGTVRPWRDLNPQQQALFHAAYMIGVSDGQTGTVTLSAPLPGSIADTQETTNAV